MDNENLSAETLAMLNAELEKQKKGEDEEALKKANEETARIKAESEAKDKKIEELTKLAAALMRNGNGQKKEEDKEKEPDGYIFPGLKLGAYYNEQK